MNFFLLKKNDYYNLVLHHPFMGFEINFNIFPKFVEVIDNYGKKYIENDIESIFKKIIGFNIPLNDIQNLIIGNPKNITGIKYNIDGILYKAKYSSTKYEWNIEYIDYYKYIFSILPKKIKLFKNKCILIIKINRWIV
ncbi:hemM [Wigglesworthia glossinidia endosymbiont of Glossina brevipalpis]|uniref:Outer-membrane lipoprotein LolB n=1 Tax=Wigglesworthia glossinidia brevipalpis TaxID=36870 RepID=Q8D2K7_WIGBR|nr:hemM [Wigglesworthia glossinidia endosymbiont of Glossina brevipalpis]